MEFFNPLPDIQAACYYFYAMAVYFKSGNLRLIATRKLLGGFLVLGLAAGFVGVARPALAQETAPPAESATTQRQILEQRLADLEAEIAKQEAIIEKYRKQKSTLSSEISSLNANIAKKRLQIKAVELSLEKLNQDIINTQSQINRTQNQIDQRKDALAKAIQTIYEIDNQNIIAILFQNNTISDFVNDFNNILLIQDSIRQDLVTIEKLRSNLISQKQELNAEKDDIENLKTIRESQKRKLELAKKRKANLLAITKNKESEYQKIVAENKKTAAQIRSQIFQLIGGGQLSFEKAYEYAKLASGATGVRPAFILAILDRESLLGKNTGKCNYKKAMHPTRDIPVFLAILKNLNIDPDSVLAKVSCPNKHGTYGGAMGPAQFIPSTWAIYGGKKNQNGQWQYNPDKDEIGTVVGRKPSNPWNNADAFAATAIYIKNLYNSKSCINYGKRYKNIVSEQTLRERCAASKYYAGSNWWTYRFWYGDAVVTQANKFQKDINVLNSGS